MTTTTEATSSNPRFDKHIWNYSLFWVLLLGAIYGTYRAKLYIDEWGRNSPQRLLWEAQDEVYQAQEKKIADLNALYAQDTIGGKTPEETWQMFTDALKAGDTDLAAQYFIPEYQEKWRENFEVGKSSGALKSFLEEDVPLIVGGSYYDHDKDKFEYVTSDINGGPGMVFLLVRNRQTNIWKIYDL